MTKAKRRSFRISLLIAGFLIPFISQAQLEVNLLTDCTTDDVRIPVHISNFDNVSSFQLVLNYNPEIVAFQQSLIHNSVFAINNEDRYQIHVVNENNRLKIEWSAYYGVSLDDGALLFLEFKEIGIGDPGFSWEEDQSSVFQIGDIEQTVIFEIGAKLDIPYTSPYQIQVQQLLTGCRDDSENGCKAQAEVVLAGAKEPYSYLWSDKFSQRTPIAIGLCQDPVTVLVKDSDECFFGAIFQAEIYNANQVNVTANPEVAYITRPNVTFESNYLEDKPQVYRWDFGDGETSANANTDHVFTQVGNYSVALWTRSDEGCDTTVYIPNYEVRELDFCIPNVFTPNGDNANDKWVFKIGDPPNNVDEPALKTGYFETKNCSGDDLIFSEHFKHSHLIVINRNGNKVFECSDCQEPWDGGSLPDGVYYYVFEWEGEYSSGREQGDITILRGN